MLDAETKARIDSARDILVGKVPDPKSQVEQITIALIYKFMYDMDRQSEEVGGKVTFFSGEFKKYRWANLLDKRLGGHERLSLYAEGLDRMNTNKNIPQLFREIFKGVFLPYRDPETLNLFLKEVNGFTYEHSERLGNAYEYLLSVLGTQGDAGQFRTPRHIIDFIVAIVDPQKDETVLDPACGTAGFLISAFKHILKGNESLTPDERARLMTNFRGYDIAPDMVRLSRVNMYLHSFPNPVIHEYDALTSEERWDDRCDVIMANPPFMTPKGGIRPHNRFAVTAGRSEILFVDYIAEHLTPGGRAGVIVPEGIIFHSQKAYKQLRRMLVENHLWAVASLPAGVFNPYAGVKTSILFFDRTLAKRMDSILFVRINNDGFDLGATRRPIQFNDLPEAREVVKAWKRGCWEKEHSDSSLVRAVPRNRILESADCSLSEERYRQRVLHTNSKWPIVALGDLCDFCRGPFGSSIKRSVCIPKGPNTYKVYEQGNVINNDFSRGEYYISKEKFLDLKRFEIAEGDILITCAGTLGRIAVVPQGVERGIINSVLMRVRIKDESIVKREYLVYLLRSQQIQGGIDSKATGVALKNMFATSELKQFLIPLPPLREQERLVTRVEDCRQEIEKRKQEIVDLEGLIERKVDAIWGVE